MNIPDKSQQVGTDLRLPKDHPYYDEVLYDLTERKYYDRKNDFFLDSDDEKTMCLPDPKTLEGYKE